MSDMIRSATGWLSKFIPPAKKQVEKAVTEAAPNVVATASHLSGAGRIFVRLAGISGVLAVALGAYGAHVFRPGKAPEELKITFETGNRYHLLHTIALLAVPLTKRPQLVGTLMVAGMVLFSGSCYYHAMTGNTAIRKVTPYGGMLLIAAWAAIAL